MQELKEIETKEREVMVPVEVKTRAEADPAREKREEEKTRARTQGSRREWCEKSLKGRVGDDTYRNLGGIGTV